MDHSRPKRADARRSEENLLRAAAAVFVTSGVEAPIRDIAAEAGVGTATMLAAGPSPYAALRQWIGLFVDFLVAKHGLAAVLQPDNTAFQTLHAYFLDRLVPVCAQLLEAAAAAGEIRPDLDAFELMRGVGNLCIAGDLRG
ncbi:TetR family transcriptional regulator [Nonomuraea spiralis]|nr:hypothetical protein [Nonomuraea spiralis]GGT11360.1 TetR family transcriptional regulator [Nonomuraea spiralis]